MSQDVPAGFAKLAQGIAQTRLITVGPPLFVYHDFIDEQNDGDMEIAVPIDGATDLSSLPVSTATPADKRGCSDLYRSVLPSCTLATIIHRGPFSEITPAYHRLFEWIHEGDFDIVGPPREVYVTDPATVAQDSLLSRVEVPVAPTIAAEPEQAETGR